MSMVRWLVGKEQNIKRNSVVWNALAGGLSAGQSAIILIFISHYMNIYIAGIFSIAFATANLFWTINKYGVRNYQVTDIREQFTFSDYLYNRGIVSGLTLVLLLIYIFFCYRYQNASGEKLLITAELTVLKIVEAFEDVFVARYQQQGRLDVGAKIMTCRLLLSTTVICILICFEKGIHRAIIGGIVTSVIADVCMIAKTAGIAGMKIQKLKQNRVISILKLCAPLCLGTTLAVYIGNIPKYMIDAYMTDEVQAIFGYIMMPVFVITLLNQFVYQPMLKGLGELWDGRRREELLHKIVYQCSVVMALTVLILVIGLVIGLPILSWMYNTRLDIYSKEFAVLLLGGGFYAQASYFTAVMTVIRKQNYMLVGYLFAVIFALLTGKCFVSMLGMMGAAVLYLIINVILVVLYGFILVIEINK